MARSSTWLYASAIVIALCSLAPIVWQLLTSVKTNGEITAVPVIYLPSQVTLRHYMDLFKVRPDQGYIFDRPFLSFLWNSFVVASSSTLLCLLLGAPAAYVLSRRRVAFQGVVLAILVVLPLFPYILLLQGLLYLIRLFSLANSLVLLVVPYTAINLPLTILTLRSFFTSLPRDLEDAARVDGFSTAGLLLKILLPLTTPALVTTGILAFIFAWNEFIFALTFITRDNLKTIPVAAAQLGATTLYEVPYGPLAAATMVGTLPLVLLVLFFQRRIIEGLTSGSVKG